MRMKGVIAFTFLAAGAVACDAGNYSNEDIDYQLALPQRQDVAVKLPAPAPEAADAPEHYRTTRRAVKSANDAADGFLTIIDAARTTPPTLRDERRRIWGPFPIRETPLFVGRLVIDRIDEAGTPTRFVYRLQFRARADEAAPWGTLLEGDFSPTGGARRGIGHVRFTAAAARAAGFPLGGLAVFDSLTLEYHTSDFPYSIKIETVSFPAMEKAQLQYEEERDGSGELLFEIPLPGPLVTRVRIDSRWIGSGAGRADVVVLDGVALVVGLKGTDCWGVDTRSTYHYRDWDKDGTTGSESACVFRAATSP